MRRCALKECDVEFQPKHKRQRCCCERHGKIHSHRLYRAAGKEVREPWGDKRREAYHRRRALRKAASTGVPVRFGEIAERDEWVCGICDKPVDPKTLYPDPMSPSLDHVIPLTKGGAHDPSNVQLAHLVCNTAKGDRLDDERFVLTG